MNHPLVHFEVFFNSGRGHLSYSPQGRQKIMEEKLSFSPAEQGSLARILITCVLKTLARHGVAIPHSCTSLSSREGMDLLIRLDQLSSELSRCLGGSIGFNNKYSEIEATFGADLLPLLPPFSRAELASMVQEELDIERWETGPFDLFWGDEYIKISLFNKGQVVKMLLDNRNYEGRVLAFGDSAVDVPFLLLKPASLQYTAYFLGEARPDLDLRGIVQPQQKGTPGMFQILAEHAALHFKGDRISCVIADIDNCVAPLDFPIRENMLQLLCSLIREGVDITLITGRDFEGCFSRVISPIESALAADK